MRKIISKFPSWLQSITICNIADKIRSTNKNNSDL